MELAVHTLGCKLNQSETSTVAADFESQGFQVTTLKNGGDVVFINSCTVTETADQECRKLVRRALRANPETFVIVSGCYAQLQPEEVASIEGVDLVLGSSEKWDALKLAGDFKKRSTPFIKVGNIATSTFVGAGLTRSGGDKTRAFLKVQDGCDYKCSFCTIPKARGASRSLDTRTVLKQARTAIMNGFKEIVLTGVNVGDYGSKNGGSFLELLEALHEVKGLERLKISSIEPNLLTDEIIALAGQSDRLVPHFHIPLQIGSDEMLSKMRRRYRSGLYRDRVENILTELPHAAIGVDVISGFPGETEAHFMDTVRFLEELPITYIHGFTYSEREDTPAAIFEERIDRSERTRRTRVLRELSAKKTAQFARRFEGKVRPVLFENTLSEGKLTGWTDNYIRVRVEQGNVAPGVIRPTRIGSFSDGFSQGWITP